MMKDFLYCDKREVEDLFKSVFPSAKIEDASIFAGDFGFYRTKHCFSLEVEMAEKAYYEELFKNDLCHSGDMLCISNNFLIACQNRTVEMGQLWQEWIQKYPRLESIWNKRFEEAEKLKDNIAKRAVREAMTQPPTFLVLNE